MADPNVFVVVTAAGSNVLTTKVLNLGHNSRWLHGSDDSLATESLFGSREHTPAGPEDEEVEVDRLVVTFDKLLLDECPDGLYFGTSRKCHILLGHRGTKGVSANQFSIFVDHLLQIWLADYTSAFGTAVQHDSDNSDQVRTNERWTLAKAPGSPPVAEKLVIKVAKLKLEVNFPNHSARDPRYIAHLRAFYDACSHGPSLQKLILDSNDNSYATTQAPSDLLTIQKFSLYHDYVEQEPLGTGTFGKVYKTVRLRDAEFFAVKVFKPSSNKRTRDGEGPTWVELARREFYFLRGYSHPNIVNVVEFRDFPSPRMYMELYPDKSIDEAKAISPQEYVTAWGQILDALAYLNSKNIVYRDLKPQNILVKKMPHFKVAISDFGLARAMESGKLQNTFCGTLRYTAPEVFPRKDSSHGLRVDIWSLGVMCLDWLYGFTPMSEQPSVDASNEQLCEWNDKWSKRLIATLEDLEDDCATEILRHMIALNVEHRRGAEWCLLKGQENGLFKRRAIDGLMACAKRFDGVALPDQDGGDVDRISTKDFAVATLHDRGSGK